jgi:GNAT superfamily N-acetyltransferase
MELSAQAVTVEEILPWRDMYRNEMNCQIVHDSLHGRKGWTQSYRLSIGGIVAGYGAVVLGGPWQGKPAVFEFYISPPYRGKVFDLFSVLLNVSEARIIDTQSNDALLSALLHALATSITSEKILFHDQLTTNLTLDGVVFRKAEAKDAKRIFTHTFEPVGEWVIESNDSIVATGGILFHYNRPYGDIFMEVAEPHRRRGIGSYLVQELKRVCYEQGSVPAARCGVKNLASRKTLQKAGFVPCGCILNGTVSI